ncbi:MAG: DUF4173 domain-containing protein [Anaerolineales bacterium]
MPKPSAEPEHPDEKAQPKGSGFHQPVALAAAGLVLGVAFEVLFFKRPLGVSFAVWVGLCLVALFFLGRREGVSPAPVAWALAGVVLLLSILPVFRAEPLTVFLDVVLALAGLALLVRVYQQGDLLSFGFFDFGLGLVLPPVEAWFRPWSVLSETQAQVFQGRQTQSALAGVGRGLLLAFPIVVAFLVLLSSADLIFGDYVRQTLAWLDLARFFDYLGRLTVILLIGVFSLGALVVALRRSDGYRLIGEDKPLLPPFLGFTEAAVVLGAVDLLFGLFVVVQLRYFFGGEANITAAGYTYAEYARRGFAELVFLALLTLGMILALGAWTRRERRSHVQSFNGLSGLLVLLTGVILTSAFMRLLLYEEAYGFSRLRTYTHVAILWMGVLFLAFLGLLLAGRLRAFAVACAVGAIGFCLTLNLLNVDAFIVRQNFANPSRAGELDAGYLATLSADAVPALVSRLDQLPPDARDDLLPGMACGLQALRDRQQRVGWPSYRWVQAEALTRLESVSGDLASYPLEEIEGTTAFTVTVGEESEYCGRFGLQ